MKMFKSKKVIVVLIGAIIVSLLCTLFVKPSKDIDKETTENNVNINSDGTVVVKDSSAIKGDTSEDNGEILEIPNPYIPEEVVPED